MPFCVSVDGAGTPNSIKKPKVVVGVALLYETVILLKFHRFGRVFGSLSNGDSLEQ